MKRFKVVNDENDNVEYYIEVTEDPKTSATVYTLKRSNNPVWSDHVRGETIVTAVDDGNNITFDKKFKSVDDTTFVELHILMRFIHTWDKTIVTHLSVEESTVIC